MAASKITFYVDVVSPFAYEAYYLIRNNAAFKSVQKTYIPVFLGGIMKSTNNQPPLNIKNKDKWIDRERAQYARLFSIPMATTKPPKFPIMTLYVQRVLASLHLLKPDDNESLARVVDKLWEAFWVRHEDVHTPEVYTKYFEEVLGAELTKKCVEMAGKEGKEAILKETQKAVDSGAFGLPWMVCTNGKGETEGFWGVDHLGLACRFLGISAPKTSDEGWKSLL